MSAPTQWFYGRDGQRHGPVDEQQLRNLIFAGMVTANDLVWREGMPQWVVAGSVTELFPHLAGTAPPPLPGAGPQSIGYATPQARDMGDDAGMRMLLPVGRSGWAIAAGYLGLFSVLMIFAPLALLFGILAIRDIRRNPKLHGMGRAIFGVVMGAIFTVLLIFMIAGVVFS